MKKFKQGTFRLIHRAVWEAIAKLQGATEAEILVFLYLEAGLHSHYSGLFHIFPVDICKYTSLSLKDVETALDRLQKRTWIIFDRERQLIFVRGMLKRQLGTKKLNEDNIAGIVYYVERMPFDSPAITAFMEENRDIPEFDEQLLDITPPVHPPGTSPLSTPGDHPDDETLRLLDVETMRRKDDETVTAEKSPALTPRSQTFSLTPESKSKAEDEPKDNVSPVGSPGSSVSEPAKSTPKTKASGKGKPKNGNGKSTEQIKKKGLRIAAKKFKSKEWDGSKVTDFLRNDYGFTQQDINSVEVADALGMYAKGGAN